MAASTPKRWVARLAACAVMALALMLAGGIDLAPQAQAQQPPPGAAQVQPGEFTAGQVPGSSVRPFADAEMWRAIRQGVRGRVSIPDQQAAQLVQSEGDNWRALREGPLVNWGAWALLGIVVLLALFYALRGRIRLEHGFSGRTVLRFNFVERMGHWLLAISFIVLALTGLNITFGRQVLLPVLGPEIFATLSLWGKYLHNYVAFAFMAALVLVLVLWIAHNFPNRHDLRWLAKGGGLFTRGSHPPARKFNAGQKIIFWLVILGGIALSLTGLALMFPFEMALFSQVFAFLNWFGLGLPSEVAPVQEMQYAAVVHAIVGLFLIVVAIAHIYIGTIGMEGAFDAMGSGEVDENWAREHHAIWAEEMARGGEKAAPAPAKTAPAE